ncbi:MAG: phosphatidylglycerophosphatase A [Mesorhizobium sp.]
MADAGRPPPVPTFARMIARPSWLVSMSLGLGLCRPWPGTWGSAGGFALFAALQFLPVWARIVAYVAIILVAVAACTRTGRDLGETDHGAMVIDETVGMSLTLEAVAREPLLWLPAFLLFRFLDIGKPWPIRLAGDALPGGWGVMADDLAAALVAAAMLSAVVSVFFS